MARKVLVVGPNALERAAVSRILNTEYEMVEAASGEDALYMLRRNAASVSVVVVLILAPGTEGFELIAKIRSLGVFAQLPIIAATDLEDKTSHAKIFSLGANNLLSKPYNQALFLAAMKNCIRLRESASILNLIRKDKLTGIHNRTAFFEEAERMIRRRDPDYYTLSCFDIDNFKVINDQYGAGKGDEVLKHVADCLNGFAVEAGGICCRAAGDKFAVLYPTSFIGSELIFNTHAKACAPDCIHRKIRIRIGRYTVSDPELPVNAMYERAILAELTIKGRYDVYIANYNEAMRERLLDEQRIISEMYEALEGGQFEPWFQPQFNHDTGAMVGAEALVRWRHPTQGILIPPGCFIPVFERNGFIYELDKYIWEKTCALIRKLIDEKRDPLPISVNISRYDVFHEDFFETITGLIQKYRIPVDLLWLEVKESAFAESTEQIVATIKKLIDFGFTVEIDDFGSGYSSLNTLKDVPASILKLDMKFLEGGGDSPRGGNILESVVRMARWLGMSVIAEGVETRAQADFLKSIGCRYVQGYLYAKPMSLDDYLALADSGIKEHKMDGLETVANLDNNAFWNPASMETLIFNSYVGGACIFEYHNGKTELLRVNKRYAEEFGIPYIDGRPVTELSPIGYLDEKNLKRMLDNVRRAIETNAESSAEILWEHEENGKKNPMYFRSTVRVIARAGDRYLIYCVIHNITTQRLAERNERIASERLEAIMHQSSSGIAAVALQNDGDFSYVFFNRRYYELLGYTKEQYEAEVKGPWDLIVREDFDRLYPKIRSLRESDRPETFEMRVRRRDKKIVWLQAVVSVIYFSDIALPVQLSSFTDITALKEKDAELQYLNDTMMNLMNKTPGGFVQMRIEADGAIRAEFCNDGFFELVGMPRDEVRRIYAENVLMGVHPDDVDQIKKGIAKMMEQGEAKNVRCRLKTGSGDYVWAMVSGQTAKDSQGNAILNAYFTDVTEERAVRSQLELLANNLPVGIATYEAPVGEPEKLRLAYFSDGFCRLFGYTREEYARLPGDNPLCHINSEDLVTVREQIDLALKGDQPMDCVFRTGGANDTRYINFRAVGGKPDGGNMSVNAVLTDVTAQQAAIEQLHLSEEEYRLAILHSACIISHYNIATRTASLLPEVAKNFGVPDKVTDIPYGPLREGLIAPETSEAYIALYKEIHSGSRSGSAVYKKRLHSEWRWTKASYSTIFSSEGEPVSAVISYFDVTEEQEKEAVYRKWQQSLESKNPESYTLFRCKLNKGASVVTAEGSLLDTAIGLGTRDFNARTAEYAQKYVFAEDRERYVAFVNSDALLAEYYRGKCSGEYEYREIQPNGMFRWLHLAIDLVEYPNSTDVEAYLMYENIDEQKRAELHAKHMAENDPLTGVLNRKTFADRVDELLTDAEPGARHAFFMLDIDGFKLLNDTFGHAAGDEALIEVANTLQTLLRHGDFLGRLGGDEFVILLNGIANEESIARKARDICARLQKSYSVEVGTSVSIGIALYPRDGENCQTLYRNADAALYAAKGSGRNTFVFYNAGMTEHSPGREETRAAEKTRPLHAEPKRRMLIVDDSRIDQEILTEIFREEYIIEKAYDGQSALVRMRHYGTAISVVLLDLMFPNGMSGFEVLERMQSSQEMRGIPVIVVSADGERETNLRAIRSGATDYILKPVDKELIRLRVKSAISRAENERLRAQNSYLQLRSDETTRYRIALENLRAFVVELDWIKGVFSYDQSITRYLKGEYDGRNFWGILLSDMVADAADVKRMQELVHRLATDRVSESDCMEVALQTPADGKHRFSMKAVKTVNEFALTEKMIVTFIDEGPERLK